MSKFDLVNTLFDKRHPYEAAVLCSFGFDLEFFEKYLLQLNALNSCSAISVIVDRANYDQLLNSDSTPGRLNRNYLLTSLKTSGVFHTKLYLLASPKQARLAIGSVNLTRSGVASNREMLAVFELSATQPTHAALFRSVLDYLYRLANLEGGTKLREQLDLIRVLCSSLMVNYDDDGLMFVHNLDRPILETVFDVLADKAVRAVQVVSPFFDENLMPLAWLRDWYSDVPIEIYVQQGKSNFPLSKFEALHPQTVIKRYENVDRYIHGKAIHFDCVDGSYVLMGSPNFTDHALCRTSENGNYEIAVLGPVEPDIARALFTPEDVEVAVLTNSSDLIVSERKALDRASRGEIDCLVEAVRVKNDLAITMRECDEFRPTHVRLKSSNGTTVKLAFSNTGQIAIPVDFRRSATKLFTIQLIGLNASNELVLSNAVWVIDLVEDRADKQSRRARRIYNDPAELYNMLVEIIETGNEQELLLFLQQFDIPLDLIVVSRRRARAGSRESEGNVIGRLPKHKSAKFYETALEAFGSCLGRLSRKLEQLGADPKARQLDNFLQVYYAMLTLLNFVGDWASRRFAEDYVIDVSQWKFVRDCYDTLIEYDYRAWQLIWRAGGYRDQINAQLAEQSASEGDADGSDTFESRQSQYFAGGFGTVHDLLLDPIIGFEGLHKRLKISGRHGLITPRVFENNHPGLQPDTLELIRADFDRVFKRSNN